MSKVRVILQSRTLSERLPAKVLLPLGGLPIAVLCARRLANTGLDVVLATSDTASDDLLARTAAEAGVRVFRGSLDDVLGRFAACAADLAPEDVVVRATGDNPLPDGAFVQSLVDRLRAGGHRYLGTASPADGLPYGLSAECFTVAALRDADRNATDPASREHVTVSMRRAADAGRVRPGELLPNDRSALRCTVDTADDYLRAARVFAGEADPVRVPWRTLVDRLEADAAAHPRCPLTLGTVQIGLRYGIANRTEGYDDRGARDLVACALALGIDRFDTARAYGEAERRLGAALASCGAAGAQVTTKVAPLASLGEAADRRQVEAAVDSSVLRSSLALRRRNVDALLFHDAVDLWRWHGAALDRADELRAAGACGAIGASVYDPATAIRCLQDPRVTRLQVPFNVLDRRWLAPEFAAAVTARPGIEVHVRSVFLQGLLLSPQAWPAWADCGARVSGAIAETVRRLDRTGAADLCLAYVRSFPWVTSAVVGVDTPDQLRELASAAARPALGAAEAEAFRSAVGEAPDRVIDPRRWT